MDHSKFAPSSAYRWLPCPPSADAPEINDPAEEAELGTGIHSVVSAADILAAADVLDAELVKVDNWEGRETLKTCVTAWLKVIENAYLEGGEVITEQRMISQVMLGGQFGGTADLLRVTDTTIHVYDLKTGMGPVSAEDNPQLAMYLLLAKEFFPGRERFFGTICQPRLDYEGTHEFTAAALANFRSLVESCPDRRDLSPGSHCKHCPLLGTCTAAYDEAVAILAESPRALPEPDPEIPAEIARWKRLVEFAPVVEELATFGRRSMLEHIQSGEKIAGWKVTSHGGRRVWANPKKALAALEEIVENPGELVDTKMKSPAQIEKLGIVIPEGLIYKPPAKPSLAKRSSPKAEVQVEDGSEFDYE